MKPKTPPAAIVLLGPTAVGKTAISFHLAEHWGGEIIVADSLQVYRHMDIGTAKPSAAERRRIPHHLLDVVEPDQPFTAGDYGRLAQEKISEVQERGRVPLVVGGCGLYIRALVDGLFSGPSAAPEIRERLRKEAEGKGIEVLRTRLASLDPDTALRISPNDAYRIIRALEICEVTGEKPSEIRGETWTRKRDDAFLLVGLWRPRPTLYRLIEERIDAMIGRGFQSEVESLVASYPPGCKPFQGLGYKHMIDYLQGRCEFTEMISRWKRDTRRYAKRQLTWFDKDDRIAWISAEDGEGEACCGIRDLIQRRIS